MKNKLQFLVIAVLLIVQVNLVYGQESAKMPVFLISVKIEPGSSGLEGKCKILNTEAHVFLLNKCLTVRRITANCTEVPFHQSESSANLNSLEITVDSGFPGDLVIEYGGQFKPGLIPRSVEMLNMIQSGLIELSDPAGIVDQS